MRLFGILVLTPALMAMQSAFAQGDIHKVKHVIIVMQENHSFDNYFGALAYAPGSPYHTPGASHDRDDSNGGCRKDDHNRRPGGDCSRLSERCDNSVVPRQRHTEPQTRADCSCTETNARTTSY
jgi:hypothetical protein